MQIRKKAKESGQEEIIVEHIQLNFGSSSVTLTIQEAADLCGILTQIFTKGKWVK